MKSAIRILAAAAVLSLGSTGSAHAQSSGNFAATVNNTQCTIGSGDGLLRGGEPGVFTLGSASITTPTSSKVNLLIGVSAVTGLFTNTMTNAGSADAKVRVGVTISGSAGVIEPMDMVTFDERYQQTTTSTGTPLLCVATGGGSQECDVDLLISTLAAHSFNFYVKNVGGGIHTVSVTWQLLCTGPDGNEGGCPADGTADACVGPATLTVQQVRSF